MGERPVVTPSAAPAERAKRKGGDGAETAATPVAVIALTAPACIHEGLTTRRLGTVKRDYQFAPRTSMARDRRRGDCCRR